MTTSVQITLIICVTLIVICVFGNKKGDGDDKQ